jgi:D-tyrosyl-tRNA(Tyr) deacylase
VERVREAYVPEKVKDGVFGAKMSVKLENDGPVTYILDSADFLANGQGSVSGADSSVDELSSS